MSLWIELRHGPTSGTHVKLGARPGVPMHGALTGGVGSKEKGDGIRDGDAPDEEKFKEFEQFIGSDGSDETWSLDDIKAAIKHYQRNGNDKDVDSDPGGLKTFYFLNT